MSRFQNLELGETVQCATVPEAARNSVELHMQEASLAELEGTFEPALRGYSAALRKESTLAEAWCGSQALGRHRHDTK